MLISENGKVVLIDDKGEEIEDVLTTLAKHGIPYMYFDGTPDKLPETPLIGIRFVFLDIELQGMKGQPNKTKASGAVARLKKIISKDNGPYVIIFWTGHQEVIPDILKNCTKEGISPVISFDLEKPLKGIYDIHKISERLENKLKDIGAFQLYVEWENNVNSASSQFVNAFSTLVPTGQNWSKDTASIFYKLYLTYVDENTVNDEAEQFKCACYLMNRSFSDTLELTTGRDLKLPVGFKLEKGTIDIDTIAKLNSSLFLCETPVSRHKPGNVYLQNNVIIKKMLLNALFKGGGVPKKSNLCKVIISPECDIAHNKMILINEADNVLKIAHRILWGLMVPINQEYKLNEKGREGFFSVGPIWHENKAQVVIFHFGTISFQSENEFSNGPLFTLSRDLLFDLQSKAANHVNRLGNFQLESK